MRGLISTRRIGERRRHSSSCAPDSGISFTRISIKSWLTEVTKETLGQSTRLVVVEAVLPISNESYPENEIFLFDFISITEASRVNDQTIISM